MLPKFKALQAAEIKHILYMMFTIICSFATDAVGGVRLNLTLASPEIKIKH